MNGGSSNQSPRKRAMTLGAILASAMSWPPQARWARIAIQIAFAMSIVPSLASMLWVPLTLGEASVAITIVFLSTTLWLLLWSQPSAVKEEAATRIDGDTDEQHFERQKVCYEQNCESFRSLNQLMWQVPLIAMTLTGGLWYGVASSELARFPRTALLAFAAVANLAFAVFVLPRVRDVMEAYLNRIQAFHRPGYATLEAQVLPVRGKRGAMRVYAALLGVASWFSALGAVATYRDEMSAAPTQPAPCSQTSNSSSLQAPTE